MRILIEEPGPGEEEQIVIRCRQMTREVMRAITLLKTLETVIAYDGTDAYRLQPASIFYFEAVDNRVFAYTKGKVYETKQKLYEIEEALAGGDFLRVSKSAVLNLAKIQKLSPALSGRFEAKLENGETVMISRQYVADLKKRIGM